MIFAVHGLPEKVVTDNGANLVSEEFANFLVTHGIKHCKVTPYWPRANAAVEGFNRTIKKAIHTAHAEGKDWCMVSPALLHLGREIRTKVPQVETQMSKDLLAALQSAQVKDRQAKLNTKAYADKKNRAIPSDIKPGDKVLFQQVRQNKLSTRYDPKPKTVLERKHPSLILQRGEETGFMRNVSHVHKLHQSTVAQNKNDDDMDVNIPQAVNQEVDPLKAVDQDVRRSVRVRHAPAHLNDYQLSTVRTELEIRMA